MCELFQLKFVYYFGIILLRKMAYIIYYYPSLKNLKNYTSVCALKQSFDLQEKVRQEHIY